MAHADEDKKITEALYEQNLDIALKNKTLSLLEKLYQNSIEKLLPEPMAQSIMHIIREDLNLEFAGIYMFDKGGDVLIPLAHSQSDRLKETLNKAHFMFKDINITEISKRPFFKQTVYDHVGNMTNNLAEAWKELIKPEHLEGIKNDSHMKTMLLFPLMTGDEVLGVLLLGLNRDYETLNAFEKESTKSFSNIIALSLTKVFLYQEVQEANVSLKSLIKQRESLVHLVTHKVKGSFTRTKYIFAGILDGTFGEINDEVKKRAQQGLDSDNGGIQTIDLVLNAANLQTGNVKYDMKNFDFKDVVVKTIEDKRGPAEAKGLKLETEIKDGNYNTLGDAFWLKEVVNNLIENSSKYTKEGKITVGLENKDGKILFSVKDTGVGITDEDKNNLFTEGGRGKDSVKVNVDSTGYGLYTVKLIVGEHKGRVWAESEGAGHGSAFYVELPGK